MRKYNKFSVSAKMSHIISVVSTLMQKAGSGSISAQYGVLELDRAFLDAVNREAKLSGVERSTVDSAMARCCGMERNDWLPPLYSALFCGDNSQLRELMLSNALNENDVLAVQRLLP